MLDPATTIVALGAIIWGGLALMGVCACIYSGMIRTPEEQAQEDADQMAYLRKSRTERMLGI